ncbi:MAG: penicillin acylase family protein [Bacteroidota bacterium]
MIKIALQRATVLLLSTLFFSSLNAQQVNNINDIDGLEKPVEILVDQWGVPHIYAETEHDLFFAQGFYAAKDRLFQFEIWRRQSTGTVAEILGSRELKRDKGTRLFKFRGDLETELNYYHPRGAKIINAFVEGVNAYIDWIKKRPEELPMEFGLLGIQPQKWTADIVISRHQGLLGNITQELRMGRAVAKLGAEKVHELAWLHPRKPILEMDEQIDQEELFQDILGLYNAYRRPVRFRPEDLVSYVQNPDQEEFLELLNKDQKEWLAVQTDEYNSIGSNNWVISGEMTQSGYPIMANDPHRSLSTPSLRYMAHLVGPGWNVIGGGEPEIPGISIGHNEHGAWGLTVYRTDGEDLYQYKTNPKNDNQYWFQNHWEDFYTIEEEIPVKGQKPVKVELKYSHHGPVVYENKKKNLAYAVKCAWMEPGGSPYLASLRMDQATNFESFREACKYSHIPGENMIWADRKGNIGWQSVGIAPIRRHFSGLVPIPGDGSHEWDGYLPITAKPHLYNPPSGMIVTANEDVTPKDYQYWDAIGYQWGDPYRGDRVKEYLGSGRVHSMMDMAELQTDYLSLPARQLTALLKTIPVKDERVAKAKEMLVKWDCRMEMESVEATIFSLWQSILAEEMQKIVFKDSGADEYLSLQMIQVINNLLFPAEFFEGDVITARNSFVLDCLEKALIGLSYQFGTDQNKWQYGQLDYKHVLIKHPMSNAVNAETRAKLDVGPIPRGGSGYTANVTGRGLNQTHGGTFRIISDTGNWDQCLATNSPGQNGNPDHPQYKNLFELWGNNQYFPLYYSRKKIESVTAYKWNLSPKK